MTRASAWTAALALFLAATLVRYWVIATLGRRWTTRILCLPGELLVTGGPFRFLRHPNYLAVAVEIAALPLVHTAWWTAIALAEVLFLARNRSTLGLIAFCPFGAGSRLEYPRNCWWRMKYCFPWLSTMGEGCPLI